MNLKSVIELVSGNDGLKRKRETLRARRDQLGAELAAVEKARIAAIPGAADGEPTSVALLDEANAKIAGLRQPIADLDTALVLLTQELQDAEKKTAAEMRVREVDEHNQLLNDRMAIVRRVQKTLESLAPDLKALTAMAEQIRINYYRLDGGRDEYGRARYVSLAAPLAVVETDRRIGDFLYQNGVTPSLAGARPLFTTSHSGKSFIEMEEEAQQHFVVEKVSRTGPSVTVALGSAIQALITAPHFAKGIFYSVQPKLDGSGLYVGTDDDGHRRELSRDMLLQLVPIASADIGKES